MRCDQGKHRAAIWRGDGQPSLSGLHMDVEGQLKSKLIQVESQASFLISHENIDGVNTEVRVLAVHRMKWRRGTHRRDYKSEGCRMCRSLTFHIRSRQLTRYPVGVVPNGQEGAAN